VLVIAMPDEPHRRARLDEIADGLQAQVPSGIGGALPRAELRLVLSGPGLSKRMRFGAVSTPASFPALTALP
jgi:hypothetical protein